MQPIRSLCVFCGSRVGADPAYAEVAGRLGALMAGDGIRLVYGGGGIGLMGVVAQAVLDGGGQVTGVLPNFLESQEVGMRGITDMIRVGSMHERKQRMFDLSDGFLVLPGGLGTLDETFEIMTWRQLRLHDKPIVLVDHAGYWAPFVALVDGVIAGGFAAPRARELFAVAAGPEAALAMLRAMPASGVSAPTERL